MYTEKNPSALTHTGCIRRFSKVGPWFSLLAEEMSLMDGEHFKSNHQGFPYLQLADLRSALLSAGSAHDPKVSETLHAGTVRQIFILKTYVILYIVLICYKYIILL